MKRSVKPSLALVAILGLAGLGATLPSDSDAVAAVTVTIGLEEGQITVAPDPVTVNRGDTLVFAADPESAIETFNVHFQDPEPLGAQASVAGLNGARGQATRERVRPDAEVGRRYKYNVRVWDGQRMRVLDPEVVIGPGE